MSLKPDMLQKVCIACVYLFDKFVVFYLFFAFKSFFNKVIFIFFLSPGVLDVLSDDLPKTTKLQNTNLVALIELHNRTGTFAGIIRHIFSESGRRVLLNTMKAIYSPYETFKMR